MLDLDLDLEADLGIDTVKQAEMFAAIRAAYNIPRDENLKLRDFPTLAHRDQVRTGQVGFGRSRSASKNRKHRRSRRRLILHSVPVKPPTSALPPAWMPRISIPRRVSAAGLAPAADHLQAHRSHP